MAIDTSFETIENPLSKQNGEVMKERDSETKKRSRPSINYPPYIGSYGSIPQLFDKIRHVAVPAKFTQDYMSSKLGMKSSSHRALPSLLKKLGFLDQANVPTDVYRAYRDNLHSPKVMARQLRDAYQDLYQSHEYAHDLSKDELASKLRTLTGAAEDDRNIGLVVGTFMALKELADFDGDLEELVSLPEQNKKIGPEQHTEVRSHSSKARQASFGISYTINLNLPATTDIEVFNAIFKSLKEHILNED